MVTLKKARTRNKTVYEADGVRYSSRTLYEFHLECSKAKTERLIDSFDIPSGLSGKSRYKTYKPVIDGITFDSLMEARYYIFLLHEQKENRIKSFTRQVSYELQPRFKKENKVYRPINYIADFVVETEDGTLVIDTKGRETVDFKLKAKLFEYKFPDLHLLTIQYYPETGEWLPLDTVKKMNRTRKKVGTKK